MFWKGWIADGRGRGTRNCRNSGSDKPWALALTALIPKIMESNLRPSSSGHGSFNRPYNQDMPPRPRVEEDTLKKESITIERKTFHFTLKENPRGRFLRITEEVNGRRDNVIIPITGLEDFQRVLNEMVKADGETPGKAGQDGNK